MRELMSLWKNRRILAFLAKHDLRRAYVGTAGGLAWAVLTPLIPLLVLTIVFSLGLRLPLGRAPYGFGFSAAYVPWVLLASSINGAAGSILEHRFLVKRVRFPVEIIPADPVLVHSVPHLILVAATAAVCLAAGYGTLAHLLLLPYFYACTVVLAVSAGLFLSALAVIVRDVAQVVPSVLQVWFWITPVAWAEDRLPAAGRTLLILNPAAYVVNGYRHALMPSTFGPPTTIETVGFWMVAASMLAAGSAMFRHLRPHFWDCL